jgi:hypothetical protein
VLRSSMAVPIAAPIPTPRTAPIPTNDPGFLFGL